MRLFEIVFKQCDDGILRNAKKVWTQAPKQCKTNRYLNHCVFRYKNDLKPLLMWLATQCLKITKKCLILAKLQNLLVYIKKCDIFRSFSNTVFLLQIYKLNVLLAKNIISKGRGFLEQNVNLTETPAVSKPQKFKICGTADFANFFSYNLFCIFEKWVKLHAMVMINFGTKIVIILMYRVSHQVFSNVLKLTKS